MSKDGCTGKVRHRNKVAACIAAKRVSNVALNVYLCHRCKGWHLGNTRNPNRVQARFDQILDRHAKGVAERMARNS